MGLGDHFDNTAKAVAENLGVTIRCAGEECRRSILQFYGAGMVSMCIPCPDCGTYLMIRATLESGVTVFKVPKPQAVRGCKAGPK